MADLRFPIMADVSYESGRRQPDRGSEFNHRPASARSLRFDRRKDTLAQAVEFEVVPRLLMAHVTPALAGAQGTASPAVSDDASSLAAIVLGPRPDQAHDYVQARLDQNIPLEEIYLHAIAPAARCLRQLWADDERDFATVTLGLWRLQQLLRDFSAAFRKQAAKPNGQRALLTLAPGSAQDLPFLMFSLVLSSEFFRRDGWEPWIEPATTGTELMTLVRDEWFDVVEISVNSDRRLEATAALVQTLRASSLNRSLCIAIGGSAARAHHRVVAWLGGDVLAADLSDSHARNRYLIDTPTGRGE
jgi:hypothetical protein